MLLTIAIPCYKSANTLPAVVGDIRREFQRHPEYDYQMVLVNDGSGDDTFNAIAGLCREDRKIIGVDLAKNYGQAAAKMAALPYVKGDILVYMDDDGQHDAAGIFELVKAIENGADVAIAKFHHKQHTFFKKITSRMNKNLLYHILNKPKDLSTSSFVAYSAFIVGRMKEYHNPFVSLLGFVMQYTTKIVNVELPHHERLSGTSGYTLKKMFKLFGDGIFCFSAVPLRFIGWMSGFSALMGLVLFLIGIVRACLGGSFSALLITACLFLVCAMILCAASILGEYIGRISLTINEKPQYSVRTTMNE